MDARISTILFAVFALTTLSTATVRLVDNSTNAASNAYTTVQAANDAALDGDTIYVIGNGASYGNLVTTKVLYWFGPGYFLPNNPETQANPGAARTGNVTFSTGSAGSSFTGFQVEGLVDFNAGNILFRRNYATHTSSQTHIDIAAPNVVIDQCYFRHAYTTTYYTFISMTAAASNTTFRNSILYSSNNEIISNSSAGALTFNHCVFRIYSLNVYNATITNCILQSGTYTANNNAVYNSMCNSTQFPALNGNLQDVNMSTVFQVNNLYDAYYLLAPNSPAIGTGQNGVDMGAFGGLYPYVLSGIPNLPTITYIEAPISGSTVNGLPITIRVRGRN
ncbi:MAG: hypothetical protein OEM52_03660 [bacterium]|nr:hypothetical protein [bacterium]